MKRLAILLLLSAALLCACGKPADAPEGDMALPELQLDLTGEQGIQIAAPETAAAEPERETVPAGTEAAATEQTDAAEVTEAPAAEIPAPLPAVTEPEATEPAVCFDLETDAGFDALRGTRCFGLLQPVPAATEQEGITELARLDYTADGRTVTVCVPQLNCVSADAEAVNREIIADCCEFLERQFPAGAEGSTAPCRDGGFGADGITWGAGRRSTVLSLTLCYTLPEDGGSVYKVYNFGTDSERRIFNEELFGMLDISGEEFSRTAEETLRAVYPEFTVSEEEPFDGSGLQVCLFNGGSVCFIRQLEDGAEHLLMLGGGRIR